MKKRLSIDTVVIPVAGYGTRALPFTKALPKVMLPLVDKPGIQYIVEEAVKSGIKQVIFVTSSNQHSIEDHFDNYFELEEKLKAAGKTEILISPTFTSCPGSTTWISIGTFNRVILL